MINFRKTLVATLAAATLAGAVATTSTEASAHGFHHWGWGFGAAAVATGLAIAASQPHYYDDGYGCYVARQAVTDDYGNFIGYRRVRVCD
jgi:hypothetical protein